MSDTAGSTFEAVHWQNYIENLGLDTSDVCMIPDCYCDGEPHP